MRVCNSHGNSGALCNQKRIKATMILMSLDYSVITVAKNAIEAFPEF